MPNHITNRISILGTNEEVKEFIKKFSTFHEKQIRKTYDDCIICCNEKEEFQGWYNEKTNKFKYVQDRNNENEVDGLPEGIKYEYIKEFIQMPDFNKIITMPKCLENFEPSLSITNKAEIVICKKLNDNKLLSSFEKQNRINSCFEEVNKKDIPEILRAIQNYYDCGYIYWYDWCIDNWNTKWNSYNCEQISENTFQFNTAWSGVLDLIIRMTEIIQDVEINYIYADEDTGNNTGSFIILNGKISENYSPENNSIEAYELAFELNENKDDYELINGKYVYKDEE